MDLKLQDNERQFGMHPNKIIDICKAVIESKGWQIRDDKEWVYLTLAEAYYGLGQLKEEEKAIEKAKEVSPGIFSFDSYYSQREKLESLITSFKDKFYIK